MTKILDARAVALIILFTVVETLVLSYWLVLLGVAFNLAFYFPILIFLGAGLLLEHLLAGISNKL